LKPALSSAFAGHIGDKFNEIANKTSDLDARHQESKARARICNTRLIQLPKRGVALNFGPQYVSMILYWRLI
jgi:hypothetical protein